MIDLKKDWKTTAIGVGGAIAMGGGQLLSSGNLDWKAYLQMAIMALFGVFARDSYQNPNQP
jgi:hypothetical protein